MRRSQFGSSSSFYLKRHFEFQNFYRLIFNYINKKKAKLWRRWSMITNNEKYKCNGLKLRDKLISK